MSHPIVINYAYHLDNIRIAKKMSVAKLCEDICDPRLYRRYRTGEKTLTHLKIIEFCEKLGLSPSDFYYSATENDRYELSKINKLYQMIYKKDYSSYETQLASIRASHVISVHNRRFLELVVIKADIFRKKIASSEAWKALAELIHYPDCLKSEQYDFIEIAALQALAEIEIVSGDSPALNRLIQILAHEEWFYLSSESRQILPSIYANVSLLLARLKRFEESKEVSKNGIAHYLAHADMQSLSLMRYIQSYSLLMGKEMPSAEMEAIRCMMSAINSERDRDIAMYQASLIKDLGFDPLDALPTYKQALTTKKD